MDSGGKTEFSVQTEFSPFSLELGGPKYLLCANKGSVHYNPGIGFTDNFNYDDLKSAVVKLIERYLK